MPRTRRVMMIAILGGALAARALAWRAVASEPAPRAASPAAPPTARVGLSEKAGVSLTLLDVEVVDREGKPLRSLTKDDFQLQLNGRKWPLYSVDDFCSCGGTGAPGVGPSEGSGAPSEPAENNAGAGVSYEELLLDLGEQTGPAVPRATGASRPEAAGTEAGTSRYIIYFDFGQLTTEGRTHAVAEAKRWLRSVKQPGDEVMVAAFAGTAGVTEVHAFTTSAPDLVAAIEAADLDPRLRDPFPERVFKRVADCSQSVDRCLEQCRRFQTCNQCSMTSDCAVATEEEYRHGRASLLALREFVASLDTVPGRKELILFQENGLVDPWKIFRTGTPRVGDHLGLVEEIGAEANASRTRLHVAYPSQGINPPVPALAAGAIELGSLLAEATGGSFNRDLNALTSLTTAARRACSCFYRLALQPPEQPARTVYHVKVRVRQRALPYRYRVEFLSEVDRLLRTATAVLRNPGAAKKLKLSATLVPLKASRGLWDASIVLAFPLDSISLLPAPEGLQGEWEAGALLESSELSRVWEMLSLSGVHRSRDETDGEAPRRDVLQQGPLSGLPPGTYRLRAFLKDKTAGVMGGAETSLALPAPGADTIVGPILLQSGRRCLIAPLHPLTRRKTEPVRAVEIESGVVPCDGDPIPADGFLDVATWICPRGAPPDPSSLTRFVSQSGVPVFRLHPPLIVQAGECFRVTDLLDTSDLAAGKYRYTIQWRPGRESKPVVAEAEFSLVRPASDSGSQR